MPLIGDKTRLAFDIGSYYDDFKDCQHITIWITSWRINPQDDIVSLPTFYTQLAKEIKRLDMNELDRPDFGYLDSEAIIHQLTEEWNELHMVFNYDPSTWPAPSYFFEEGSRGVLLCSNRNFYLSKHKDEAFFLRVEISKSELLEVLRETLRNLSDIWV